MPRKTGKIKWFDTTKGFGFVIDDDGGSDILLHANVLRDFGLSSVVENSIIEATTVETERGHQVATILSLDIPEYSPETGEMPKLPEGDFTDLPLEAARVKWFDKAKGFGFINIFGSSDDVFLHVEVLRAYGMAELQQGEAVGIKTSDGPRGKMVVEVRPWDFAS